MKCYEILIIGGGLAGLTAAIHLAKNGRSVCLFEKEQYPHHKVCGEYVSNEIVPYLNHLGVSITETSVAIDTLQLSTVKGQSLEVKLPLGGVGISRYALDNLLYKRAVDSGVRIVFQVVTSITFENDGFSCSLDNGDCYEAKIAIGAYGKRSTIDKQLNRDFIKQKSAWLGVKCHYEYSDFPENKVALHNFNGGYGGLSKTETGDVNFCYLASYQSFKRYKDISKFNKEVICQNPFLASFMAEAKPLFDAPLSIAQISFDSKPTIENHMIMCGDAAGLIHPLCGNGMAMAIHSAKLASESILKYFDQELVGRKQMEQEYNTSWQTNFNRRMTTGRSLQAVLLNESLSKAAMSTVAKSTWLLQKILRQTHGNPIQC